MTNRIRTVFNHAFTGLFICTALYPAALHAASFDCAKAALYSEKAVCDDADLSELDDELSASYQATYADSTTASSKQLKLDQQQWLKRRNACHDRVCIKAAYEARLREMNIDSECPLARCTGFAETEADQQLLESAEKGDTTGAKAALTRGADLNICGSSYERALHLAVKKQNLTLIRELLLAKANPNFMSCGGQPPLVFAAYSNNIEISMQLLSAGADIELGGRTSPLHMAAYYGHVDMLKNLLTHGANPNVVRANSTPLLLAAGNGNFESVQLLLDAGANPNFRTSFGGTALFDAVGAFRVAPPKPGEQERALKVVKLLVQHGANVNAKTGGQSALQRARALSESAIVEFLTVAGATQ